MTYPFGFHPSIPLAEYVRLAEYGSSDLRAFRNGPPAIVPWRKANPSKDTDATRIGTAAHCLILTPDLYPTACYEKAPDEAFRTTEAKAKRDALKAAGTTILSPDEAAQVRAIRDAFNGKALAREALASAVRVETTMLWQDREYALRRKGRPDFDDGEYVYDLKVSIHGEKGNLPYRAWTEGWLHQLASNREGLRALGQNLKSGRLIVVAPNPPQSLRVWCLEAKEAALDILEMENGRTCAEIEKCEKSGEWPSTPDAWTKVEPPPQSMREVVAMIDMSDAEEAA